MARWLTPRATWAVLRAGDLRARMRALRDGQAALRLAVAAAALSTGLLDALAGGPRPPAALAAAIGARDEELLAAWLRVVASLGLVRRSGEAWELTRRGRALRADDLARASTEAFAGFHTGLYRELRPVLEGRFRRRDVAEHGELISRVSAGFEPFVLGRLARAVPAGDGPRRVLDVGCGAGVNLATMVSAHTGVTGVGLDVDAASVAMAEETLREWGITGRAEVVRADVREVVRDRSGPFADPFDVALLANVLYYLPPEERLPLLGDVAGLLAPGGRLLVVTTVAEPGSFSRHFDLLLRAQEGRLQLPDGATLARQLEAAGLRDVGLERLVPGQPLVLVAGTRA
jgi:SAM-dependent methyltransferase